jgi:hypothetical protein
LRWVANFNQDKKKKKKPWEINSPKTFLVFIRVKASPLISSKTIQDLNLVSLSRGEKRIISSAFHPE